MTTQEYEEIAQGMRPRLTKLGRSFFSDDEELAEDAVQEALMRLVPLSIHWFSKTNSILFGGFSSYSYLFASREDTFVRKTKEKFIFLWFFAHLFVSLQRIIFNV